MRLKGTGKDPENRYPEGLIFDAPEHIAQKTIEAGFATALDPKDDPARTESQIAAAVQRGDNLNEATDHELAGEFRGEGESPEDGPDALEVVHGTPVDEPVPGGATAKAPVGPPSEDPAAVQARAESGDSTGTLTPDGGPPSGPGGSGGSGSGESGSSSSQEKELTPKQKAVERAKELDVSHSGSQADIEERIAAKEKEIEEQNAAPSDELKQRAQELEVDAEGTTAEVEARIAAKEKELADAGGSQS
jgi:hypothetical protein